MDQTMKWIYIAYFNQDTMGIVGVPEKAKLASALQMMQHKAIAEMSGPWNPSTAYDTITIRIALKFVKKYSICDNL